MYKLLTNGGCLPAAKVFLNAFGFILDDKVAESVSIFDKSGNEVGTLCFKADSVFIDAAYCGNTLTANYKVPTVYSSIDIESGARIEFSNWRTFINFSLKNNENYSLDGKLSLSSSIDDELGIHCRPGLNMKFMAPTGESIDIEMLNDSTFFRTHIMGNRFEETLYAHPYTNWVDELMVHQVSDMVEGKGSRLRSIAVHQFGGEGEKGFLSVRAYEDINDNVLIFKEEKIAKEIDFEGKEKIAQRGKVMKQFDPELFKEEGTSYFDKIALLREIITIGDTPLLDNLFTLCYDNISDEVVKALTGINKNPSFYQSGASNLVDAYYELNKSNRFGIDVKRFKK